MYPAGSVYISKAVTNLQMHKGLQTRPCKYQRCALLHISTRARFSLKDNSRERVSYLKSSFSNSLDAASPSFELQGPCKHTQRGKKKKPSQYHEKADRESAIASRQREFPFATKRCERGWK